MVGFSLKMALTGLLLVSLGVATNGRGVYGEDEGGQGGNHRGSKGGKGDKGDKGGRRKGGRNRPVMNNDSFSCGTESESELQVYGTSHRGICCPVECSQCGGRDCAKAEHNEGFGAEACCTREVKANGIYCDDSPEAPCIMGSAPESATIPIGKTGSTSSTSSTSTGSVTSTDTVLCGNGMAGYEDDDVCCPTECGQCGGAGCSTSGAAAGLGSDSCCYSGVKESKEDCEVTLSPPCVMG